MTLTKIDPGYLATLYHRHLPARLRGYLNGRGIPNALIGRHLLGWNGRRMTIPIFNREGHLAFFKLAKDPDAQTPSPKMMASPGASIELYGWEQVRKRPPQLIICEGEFDRLVLESQGFAAVTSTGGAGTFRAEWAKEFESIPDTYICFDRDAAGQRGAVRVALLIPQAKLVMLPEAVGEGGDVTDFFVRLGRSKEEFLTLMAEAKPAPPQPPPSLPVLPDASSKPNTPLTHRIERIKTQVPIDRVIGQYVRLRHSGNTFIGICPFHPDRQPSLVVYPATATFHCFGCQAHGDVITFLVKIEQLSFPQALDVLDHL